MKKLYLIGFGPGNKDFLTTRAKNIIEKTERILSTARLSKSYEKIKNFSLTDLIKELETNISENTAVLVSGDSCFFSFTKNILKNFHDLYDIEIINGISSIQYFSSKIAISYDDALMVSMHGQYSQIVSKVSYNKKVFALTGGAYKAHDICEILFYSGLRDVKIIVGEKLSYDDEKITIGTPKILRKKTFDELAVIYIENNSFENPFISISDDEFIRDNIPMTKEEVRCITLQKLKVLPTDIIFDIGTGTGSVAIEMARKAFDGFVYAIEKNNIACSLIEKNRTKHGAFNIKIINDIAPNNLELLPIPNKVFIGGSSGNIDDILKKLIEINPSIKIVLNVISIEGLNQILESFKKYNFKNTEISCINISKSKKAGNYNMMMANNPVYIICGKHYE